jgi:hypothetical protein
VTLFAAIGVALPLFENHHLGALALLGNFSNDTGASHGWRADFDLAVLAKKQNLFKRDVIASLGIELLNDDLVTFGNFILFATCLYDREHGLVLFRLSKCDFGRRHVLART